MNPEPVETRDHAGRQERTSGEKTYTAEKLRGAAVMYGPSVALDLFQGACVLAAAFGRLPDPQTGRAARVLRPIMSVGALTPWAYLLFIRPWLMNWGATSEEVRKRLPGDDFVPHPALESTRALTLRAPAEEVWRWLVQLGQDRGGFYSYDFLENLAAADIHNVDRIVPEMQHLKVGDFVPMAPVEWGVPMGGFTVVRIEPQRAVVWRQGWPEDVEGLDPSEAESRGTWAFVLEEIDEGTTRLILRERSGRKPHIRDVILNYLLLERQHFVMVRRMLLGIKERAERAQAVLEREIVIDRPVEDVFDFVTDARNEPRFNPRIVGAEKTTSGPIGRGTRFVLTSKAMGQRMAVEYEIIAYERPRRMTSRTIRGLPLMDVESTETFEPVGYGTRMRWVWEIKPRGVVGRLMTPALARMLGRRLDRAFANIKRVLEAGASAAHMDDRV